ncbi:MAG: hypothetical protein ACU84J_16325 [Gammaproteobacteria bacterium]
MKFIRNIVLSLIVACSFGAVSSVSFAAGKIENATTAEVKEAIDKAINATDQAIAALQNGGDADAILGFINDAGQASKRIESNRLDVIRTRAASKLKKARKAVMKAETDEAIALLSDALKGYQEIKKQF